MAQQEDVHHHRSLLASELSRKNPLAEWLIYALLLGAIITIFAGRIIFSAFGKDETGLVAFISIFFFAAMVKSLVDVVYVTHQLRLANRQLKQLWEANNIRRFLEQSTPSLFRQHISSLYQIYCKDSTIMQDNLIELLQARLHSRIRIVDLASTLLVTLGLVGTIVGLIASVAGLGLTVDNVGVDEDAMLSGMKDTLGGMGTAFFTTLVGAIFGGVVLRILFSVVERHMDYMVTHIGELTEVHILPVLRNAARMRERAELAEAGAQGTSGPGDENGQSSTDTSESTDSQELDRPFDHDNYV